MAPLLVAAGTRSFTVAMTGVLLGLYFAQTGAGASALGAVVGAGAAGSALATAAVAWRPWWFRPRATLVALALLSGLGLLAVSAVSATPVLIVAAFAGMVNGVGRDRGPAQALEQSILADRTGAAHRTTVFTRYALVQDVSGAAGAFAAGPLSGGAFNPAVGLGPILFESLMGGGGSGNLWLYLVGPLAGAVVAAQVFKLQHAGAVD